MGQGITQSDYLSVLNFIDIQLLIYKHQPEHSAIYRWLCDQKKDINERKLNTVKMASSFPMSLLQSGGFHQFNQIIVLIPQFVKGMHEFVQNSLVEAIKQDLRDNPPAPPLEETLIKDRKVIIYVKVFGKDFPETEYREVVQGFIDEGVAIESRTI